MKLLLLMFAVWALLVVDGHTVDAATFTVTKTVDSADGTCSSSDCSLREAVIVSNATAGADTIVVPAGTYTYNVGLGAMPEITESVTIVGAGAHTTEINANGTGSVLRFASTSGATALVSGVTITGGLAQNGAGVLINNYGTVTLRKVTIRDNVGTGSGSGGGILVFPDSLVVENSTLSGNSAFSGGALFINTFGTATLTNVTISGNQALEGAGITNGSTQGGVTVSLTNVTLANNVQNPNFGNPGNGIHNFGRITLKNTILADNTAQNCFNSAQHGATIVSSGHNLDDDGTCVLTTSGDISGTDPLLGALQNNGGPTFTHGLSTSSPAVDAGDNNGCPATDQRGQPRPADGDANDTVVCDIGAYEAPGNTTAVATPPGSMVEVEPVDATTGTTPVGVTFSSVSEGGYTSLATSDDGLTNPGFKLGNPPIYYEISTSAVYAAPVEVCIDYSSVTFTNENNLKLFHFEGGAWVNKTTSHDKVNDIICGTVGSLSPFAVFEDDNADTEADGFAFADVTNVQPNKVVTSNAVTISGINTAVAVSVFGGTYSKNGGAFTSAAGTALNGDTFRVRHVSGARAKVTVNTTLTVGGVSDTFSSTTVPNKK